VTAQRAQLEYLIFSDAQWSLITAQLFGPFAFRGQHLAGIRERITVIVSL
jgi:hypothetical protein